MRELKVLIIDDNFVIREQIKKSLRNFEEQFNTFVKEFKLDKWRKTKDIGKIPDTEKIDFKIYSADDGVEGLGYMYALKPDLVIVDTTLPKYSGKEILDFIQNNTTIETKVIVMSEEKDENRKYVVVNKKGKNFLNRLEKEVRYLLNIPKTHGGQGRVNLPSLVNSLVNQANKSDLLLSRYYRSNVLIKLLILPYWILLQLVISLMYFINTLFTGRSPRDESIEQAEKDLLSYRVRYYPTLITVFTTILILLVQVGLFVSGGLVIFNTRIESVFALAQNEKGYEFNESKVEDYEYDEGLIEITNNGLSLKLVEKEIEVPEEDLPESFPQEILEPSSYPGVLGASTQSSYSTEKPFIITKNPIKYSNLKEIIERSSLNSEGSSTLGVEEYGKQLEKLEQDDPRKSTKITYQLSPNKNDWYYWNGSRWENTKQGWVSSNTIQEINNNLTNYEETLGTGELFLKIFLHSTNGKETPILKEIVVEREQEIISQVVNELPQVEIEEQTIGSIDFQILEPVILNAAYVNGEKVIKGRLLPKNRLLRVNYSVTQEELDEYEVKIYYSDSEEATRNEPIGTTDVYLNQKGIPEFFLRTPESDGGYITAQVMRTVNINSYNQDTPESYIVENPTGASDLASPLKNSSFVVTSTGDGADSSAGDASCDDGTGECTLRAAIQESNALLGADEIYFDIPVEDDGYVDYDECLDAAPWTCASNSGDSTDGDDYWRITPGSALPQITETLTIDGATTNGTDPIPDTNTSGPEIEIDGVGAGNVDGIYFTDSADGSSINALVINNFSNTDKRGIYLDWTDNFTLTKSYLGTDVKSIIAKSNYEGIRAFGANNLVIGNDSSDGNVVSGNLHMGIRSNCRLTGGVKTIQVRGNKFGMDKDGTVFLSNTLIEDSIGVYFDGVCDVEIGGELDTHRNYFTEGENDIALEFYISESDTSLVKIYNNFFGTDLSGLNQLGEPGRALYVQNGGTNQVNIGDVGKGNLFRFASNNAIFVYWNAGDISIKNNSFGDNSIDSGATMYLEKFDTGGSVDILNNQIGEIESDPYFGVELGPNNSGLFFSRFISESGNNIEIKGNRIKSNFGYGIRSYYLHSTSWISATRLDPLNHNTIIVGGQNEFGDSLCHGMESNCIENNGYSGLESMGTSIFNEDSIYQDNFWGEGNGINGNSNVIQNWPGTFEIFSATHRRTDLSDDTIKLSISEHNTITENSRIINQIANYKVPCIEFATCPLNADSSGEEGYTQMFTSYFYVMFQTLEAFYYMQEYYIDNQGVKIETGIYKFDQPHIASEVFSFDGDSTTHPVETGVERVSDGKTYYDRGEPWTDNPDATGDPATANYGNFQIMEVELVDANPVLQDDGTYVITVDSTTDEDNVSSAGYDCGTGTSYECGGSEGPDGLADGKTSLREAIYVAGQHPGKEYIHFDIPVDDVNHKCYRDDGVEGHVTEANIETTTVLTDSSDDTCGSGTADPDHPYSWFDMQTSGDYTISSEVTLDGYTQEGTRKNTASMGETLNHIIKIDTSDATFNVNGGNSEITGIVMPDGSASININSSNNHLKGAYIGTDISGLNSRGLNHNIYVKGSSNVIGSDLDEANDNSEINIFNSADSDCQLSSTDRNIAIGEDGNENITIAKNYINTDKRAIANSGDFRGSFGINWGKNVVGSINNILIKDNIIANSNIGVGSFYTGLSVYFDIDNNRINTNWLGDRELTNNICSTYLPVGGGIVKNSTLGEVNFDGDVTKNIIYSPGFGELYGAILFMYFSGNNRIEDNHLYGGASIYARSEEDDPLIIKNNIITESYKNGLLLGGKNQGIVIKDNKIFNNCLGDSSGSDVGVTQYDMKGMNFSNNQIGIDVDGNLVSSSCDESIKIENSFTDPQKNISVKNNKIFTNNTAIDLVGGDEDRYGITSNDHSDTDTGPNDLMNYPVIEQVNYMGGGEYTLYGSLDNDVTDESPFEIEICESYDHESGHGGCLQTLGFTTANSPWEKTVKFEGDDGTQERIFSTLATNAKGSTSEFSENFIANSDNPDYYIVQYPIELVYPIGGQEIVDRTPLLDWNSNGDPDIDHWEVYLGRSADNLNKVGEIEGSRTNFQVSKSLPLDYNSYYWKVVDIRKNGTIGGESSVESFKVIENLQHLNLIYPTGSIKIDETKPVFQWTKSSEEDVTYYELYLREKMPESYAQSQSELISQENKLTRIEGNDTTEYQPIEDLKLADYEWQVVAYYADAKESGRSEVGDFSIVEPEVTVTQGRVERPDGTQEDEGDLGQARGISVEQALTLCCLCLCCVIIPLIVIIIFLRKRKNEKQKSNKSASKSKFKPKNNPSQRVSTQKRDFE